MGYPHVVGARRRLARPRRMARQCIVADTSRPTRSADQQSSPLHDHPAVNGRAQSLSRLKPADPNGPCTWSIDPSRCAPHSPLQGACGLSPGLQPRAFAGDHPRRSHHRTAAPIGMRCRPSRAGRVRQRLTPTRRGACPTAAGRRLTAAAAFLGVGATRGLPRGRVRRWPGQRATMMCGQAQGT